MKSSPVYSLTVPSVSDSLTILEDLCEIYITAIPGLDEDALTFLRLSVAEGCRNALSQEPGPNRVGTVGLSFYRTRQANGQHPLTALEINDSGIGLQIEGNTSPYPREVMGREIEFLRILDYQIIASVADPFMVRLKAAPVNGCEAPLERDMLISSAQPRGLGLLALCRCWQEVLFVHEPGAGTTLRLSGPVAAPVSN